MIARFLNPPKENSPLFLVKKRYLQALALIGVGMAVIGILAQLFGSGSSIGFTAGFLVANLVALVLANQGRIRIAAAILTTIYIGGALASSTAYLLLAVLAVITAATLGNTLIYVITNIMILGVSAINIIALMASAPGNPDVMRDGMTALIPLFALVVVSLTVRFFIQVAENTTQGASATTDRLRAAAEIGQVMASMLQLDELLPHAVNLIRDRYGFYHAQVFLVDVPSAQAILVASTGDAGRKLIERGHQLGVGSQSVIGRTTSSAQPVIARDTDAFYYRNELLPNTRSELALPIIDGGKVIGALDVQSTDIQAFQADDVRALQVIANLLAVSIRNARLFQEQEQASYENKRLLLESEANFREIQRLNRQMTKAEWDEYIASRHALRGVSYREGRIVKDGEWSEILTQAAQGRREVVQEKGHRQVIAVPVMLGKDVIGAIEVEPGSHAQHDALEMVRAVAQRLAISLDKSRLFEESQEATIQEQNINSIVARYQTVNTVDDLLKITLTELSQTLGAKSGAIRLGQQQTPPTNGATPHD